MGKDKLEERRWEDGVKGSLKEVLCVVVDWIRLAQNRNQWSVHMIIVVIYGVL